MINNKGMFSISIKKEFNDTLNRLIHDKEYRNSTGKRNAEFIKKNKGAVAKILDYLQLR